MGNPALGGGVQFLLYGLEASLGIGQALVDGHLLQFLRNHRYLATLGVRRLLLPHCTTTSTVTLPWCAELTVTRYRPASANW